MSVDLYDCCVAGEADLIAGNKAAELPATAGQVQVSTEVFMPDDGSLNVDVQLHSSLSLFVDTAAEAHVRSFAGSTRIDSTPVGEPVPETTVPAITLPAITLPAITLPAITLPVTTVPPTTQRPRICVLGICL